MNRGGAHNICTALDFKKRCLQFEGVGIHFNSIHILGNFAELIFSSRLNLDTSKAGLVCQKGPTMNEARTDSSWLFEAHPCSN